MAPELNLNKDLVNEVFGADKSEKALTLLRDALGNMVGVTEDSVARLLVERGFRVKPRPKTKGAQRVSMLKKIFKQNGIDDQGRQWTFDDVKMLDRELVEAVRSGKEDKANFADLISLNEQPLLFPKVISELVKEAIEPNLVLTQLLQTIRFSKGSTITFPAVSSFTAGDLVIPESGEYPEGKMQYAGTVTAKIGKHGIKVSMTEEAMRYSLWDIWAMHIRAAGRALARHKEQQVVKHVFNLGTNFFDNTQIGTRKTTGRDISGAFNGTFTQDDLWEMWADLVQEGYVPDLILMHPFAWPIFARDPVLRNLGYLNGSGANVIGGNYQGSVGRGPFDMPGLFQNRESDEPANLATTFAPVPSTFPFGSMRIIISPFVPYDFTTQSTDIYLADSRDLGVIVVDEEVTTADWNDPNHDIRYTKFRELYGIANANNGISVRIAKGCVVTKSYDFSLSTIQASVTLGTSEFTVS